MSDKIKKINDALSEIDGKYLDTAERMRSASSSASPERGGGLAKRGRRGWLKWGAAAAAVLLIVGAVSLARHNANVPPYPYPEQGIPPIDEQSAPPVVEPSTPPEDTSPADPTPENIPVENPLTYQTSGEPTGPYAQFIAAQAEYPVMVQYQDNTDAWWDESWARSQWLRQQHVDLSAYLTASVPLLLADTGDGNRVCSPLNIYMALAMAAEISDGESRAQILDLLGADSIEALRESADKLWDLNYRDDGVAVRILASSLWMRDDFDYNAETLERLCGNYHASSFYGDMSDPQYTAALRDWLNAQTGGQLQEAVQNVTLDPQTVLELVTTVYFRAKWLGQFDAADTSPEVFHAPGGDIECDFLHDEYGSFWAYHGERFIAVQQSFEAADSMWFLLPDEGVTPEALLSDPEALAFLISGSIEQAEWYHGRLALPKLDVTSDLELSDMLKALGVTDVFDSAAADFSPLFGNADGIALSNVQHAARLVMDEEGVTATAFTAMGWAAGGPEFEMDFILDRPFLFKIDGSNNAPLFVGIVNQP